MTSTIRVIPMGVKVPSGVAAGIGIRYFEISDISDIQKISGQKMTKKYQKKKDKKISEKK